MTVDTTKNPEPGSEEWLKLYGNNTPLADHKDSLISSLQSEVERLKKENKTLIDDAIIDKAFWNKSLQQQENDRLKSENDKLKAELNEKSHFLSAREDYIFTLQEEIERLKASSPSNEGVRELLEKQRGLCYENSDIGFLRPGGTPYIIKETILNAPEPDFLPKECKLENVTCNCGTTIICTGEDEMCKVCWDIIKRCCKCDNCKD